MEDKNRELVNHFFQIMGDERFLVVLEKYANGVGYGIEHVWCVFADDYEEWEEDYFGDFGIAFYFDYPAVEEDEEVVLDYKTLYIYLKEIAARYLENHPEKVLEIGDHMEKIKARFKNNF